MALTEQELDYVLSTDIPAPDPEPVELAVDSPEDFRAQMDQSFRESVESTAFAETEQDGFDLGKVVLEGPAEMALAAVEVPAVLGAGLAGTIVGGVESAGRGVLGMIDESFYPQESGYESFEDLIQKRQDQFSIDPEGDYSKAILGELAWAGQKAEDAATWVGKFMGYDVAQAVGVDKPEANAGIATATKLFAESGIDVLTGKTLTTAAKVTKNAPGVLKKAKLSELKQVREDYIARAADRVLDDWAATVENQTGILESLESARLVEETIPGYRFDLAEATQSDILRGKKKDLVTRYDPAQESLLRQRAKNDEAIDAYTRRIFGDDYEAFSDLVDKSNKSYGSIISNIDRDILKTKSELQESRFDITATGSETTKQGKRIRDLSDREFKLKKAKANVLFDAIGEVPINIGPAYAVSKNILSQRGIWDQDAFPAIVQDVVSKVEKMQPTVGDRLTGQPRNTTISLSDFRSLYTEINKVLTATRHKPESNVNKNNQLRLLGQLKESVKQVLENSKKDPISGKDSKAYANAIDFWRDEVAEPYQSGIMGDILEPGNRVGEYAKSADDIVNRVFKNAKSEEFAEFVDVAKRGSGPYTALRDSILVFYKDQVSRTAKFDDGTTMSGVIDPERHAKFFRDYGQLLDEVPEIKASLENISRSHEVANQAILNKQAMKKAYEDQQLKKLIDMSDPQKFFNKIKTADGARSVMAEANKLGIPKDTVSRAAASELLRLSTVKKESGKPAVLDPVKMNKALRDNYGLQLLISRPHQKSLLASLRAAEESNFRFNLDLAPGDTGIVGVIERITGKTAVSTNTELRAMRQGRLSPKHIFESTLLSAFAAMNKRQVNRLLSEAMFDPDLAKITEKITRQQVRDGKVSPKLVKSLWNRLDGTGKTALLGEFVRNREGEEDGGEDAP